MKINRRGLLKGMSIAGVGSALLAYQNCAPSVEFASMKSSGQNDGLGNEDPNNPNDPSDCVRSLSIYDSPAKLPYMNAKSKITTVLPNPTGEAAAHSPNAKVYKVPYFDHATSSQKDQYLLTVDVAHPVSSSSLNDTNIVTDVYVINPALQTNSVLFWKRFGGNDEHASAMFLLDSALVQQMPQLVVVVHCLMHGFFVQPLDLSDTPLDYFSAVAPWQQNTAFGSCDLKRPYVSVNATGGQGNLGAGHAPSFLTVTEDKVEVVLGAPNAKHGRAGSNHYMAGGYLYDQNSNLLSKMSELSYANAADHKLVFEKPKLMERGVKALRVVVMDTFNGHFQSFLKL